MTATHYRRRPAGATAVRWTGENWPGILDAVPEAKGLVAYDPSAHMLLVRTAEGRMRCHAGDWLVYEDGGRLYPYGDEEFHEVYEPVGAPEPIYGD